MSNCNIIDCNAPADAVGHYYCAPHAAEHADFVAQIDPRLRGYDWDEVFKYVGDAVRVEYPFTSMRSSDPRSDGNASVAAVLGDPASTAPFYRGDIAQIIAMEAGDNDGPDWVVLARLKDGRYAFVWAGCDYTGWG